MNTKSTGKISPEAEAGPMTFMSELELARLGDGHVAYIRTMSSSDAKKMFPMVSDIPNGINLFALHAADGTPIALTDTLQAAIGHAQDGDLSIAALH